MPAFDATPTASTLELATFAKRAERSEFVARRFASYLQESLLDVGCYDAPLRTLLTHLKYTGVDFAGSPDLIVDLDRDERLPFDDASFHCVCCIEVLEHLESLHRMVDELVRVSRRYVIVSLPNCWRDARRPIERGKGEFAHYGLPPERPNDRHRWFFSFSQGREFLRGVGVRHSLRMVELFGTEQHRHPAIRWARRIRYPRDAYMNRYAQTVWAVLEKPPISNLNHSPGR